MAKNLKLNIKNTQLAQALNLDRVKGKLRQAKEAAIKKQQESRTEEAPAAGEEEPRRATKARAKNAPPPRHEEVKEEEVAPTPSPAFGLTAEEAKELQEAKEEHQRAIERSKSLLKGEEEEIAAPLTAAPLPDEEPKKPAPPPPPPAKKPFAPYREAPKHMKRHPTLFPELKTRDIRTGEPPSVRLGPTGRHIKDLVKPKSEEPKKEVAQTVENVPPPVKGEVETVEERETKRPAKQKEFLDVKPLKKPGLKSFDSRDRQGLRTGEDESWRRRRPIKSRQQPQEDITIRPTSLKVRLPISIKDLAAEMKLKASQLIAKLFLQGVVVTLNDLLDDETTVQLLGHEFGCSIGIDTSEQERIQITGKSIQEELKETEVHKQVTRAPVVTFMGHVDHGKTSLIDAIRKSNRVAEEAGAITQHIGAFCCKTPVGDITILDTPGHEAFSAMRARGAEVTDIVVLVVAGDEGIKQQTVEALNQAKEAKVTIVVAINKADKPGFNAEKIFQQLSEHMLVPEAWGGTTITVNCSALTGQGVPQLLEMLALQAEVLELKADPATRARGTVLESEMHKGLGAQTTVLVQNGTLHLGDAIVFESLFGRVKTMRDEHGMDLAEAGPSQPVLITGLSGLPEAGQEFIVVKNEKEAKEIAEKRAEGLRQSFLLQKKTVSLENMMQQAASAQKKVANFILRADVQGSLEALKASLLNIKSSKIDLNIISAGVGEISESDVELAAASEALIIGFHTQVESHADTLIKQTGVKVRLFNVIYHAIEETKKLLVDLLDKIPLEKELGSATVLATFKSSQVGIIAGCMVNEGSIIRNQKVRLLRDGKVIWLGNISSLKRLKEDVREVKKGLECGILLEGFSEVKEGDIIQCYEVTYLTQEL